MHSITPYFLRSYNQRIDGKSTHHVLSSINSHDLFDLIAEKLADLEQSSFVNHAKTKQIYRVSNLDLDPANRIISAWFEMGRYGNTSQIIHHITGNLVHSKAKEDADVNKYFITFSVPLGETYGFAVVHGIANSGVKTLVYNELNELFKDRTKQHLSMNVASNQQMAHEWNDAITKEITLKAFVLPSSDIADGLVAVPDSEDYRLDLVIKPKRGRSLPFFSDLKNKSHKFNDFLEVVRTSGYSSESKITLEKDGKKRVFNLNKNIEDQMSSIEIDDSVVTMIDGNPEFSSLQEYSLGIIEDLKKSVKP